MTSGEAAVHDMSYQEVAEYDGTFEEAVGSDIIPKPRLMQYNDWIAWRKATGKRPTKKLGSERATTSGEESELWKSAMLLYYDGDWRMRLDAMQLDIVDKQDQEASETAARSGFTLGATMVEELSGSAPATKGAGAYSSSDHGSDNNSAALSVPGTPRGLQLLLNKPYDPVVDTYDRYEKRAIRVTMALSMQDIYVDRVAYRSN